MRVLVYSDVHANLEALAAVDAEASGQYETSVCLGDLIGYGANPNETAAWARERSTAVIRGNHDRAGAELHGLEWFNDSAADSARWTHRQLRPEILAWLRELPPGPHPAGDAMLVHGSPADEDRYVIHGEDARSVFESAAERLYFFGHTHVQGGFGRGPEGAMVLLESGGQASAEFALHAGHRYLINPGSVGQPRDGDWRAAYAIYDSTAQTVCFHRVRYDVETAQAKIRAAGLPESLARRLALGR